MGLWEDVRFAARLLVKDKWFTLVAAIALALGIGVNATVFTFVNAVLIRGLPIEEPDEVMALDSRDPVRNRNMGVSYLDYRDWKESTRTFESLAAFTGNTANVSDEGKLPERYSGAFVTANTFHIMRQRPMLGRDFLPEDDRPGRPGGGAARPRRLAEAATASTRTSSAAPCASTTCRRSSSASCRKGSSFRFNADLWQPLSIVNGIQEQKRNARGLQVFGRLAPGVTRDQAQAELINVGQQAHHRLPRHQQGRAAEGPDVQREPERRTDPHRVPVVDGRRRLRAADRVRQRRQPAAGAIDPARAARSRCAISLGATRWRVIRQLLIESVLLALISGAIGLAHLAGRHPAVRPGHAGRRPSVLDPIHDGSRACSATWPRSAWAPA